MPITLNHEITLKASLRLKEEGEARPWETLVTIFSIQLPAEIDVQALLAAIVAATSKKFKD